MKQTVLVVGDSLAGLTAAFHLVQRGFPVTVLNYPVTADSANDRPFVFMGGDRATRSLIETLETAPQRVVDHASLALAPAGGRLVGLRRLWLPAPLHTMANIALFSGLSVADRWRLLSWIERTWERDPALPIDLDSHTAEAWFRGIGQSERARSQVWTPLARFLLGEDIKCLSAASLLNELMRCFLSSRSSSQVIIPRYSFEDLLDRPLRTRLTRLGVTFRTELIDRFSFDASGVTAISHQNGSRLTADRYILALPHHRILPLLPERILTKFSYFQQLSELTDSPSVAVTLQTTHAHHRPRLILLAGKAFHWLCLSADGDTRGTLISFVAQGSSLLKQSEEELLEKAIVTLKEALPYFPAQDLRLLRIVHIPRARLVDKPGTAAHRPLQQSPFKNLFLAGSWTDTGLPSGAESAIVSGMRCGELITHASDVREPAQRPVP